MSHFTCIVAIDGSVDSGQPLRDAVEAALAPFDENIEVSPYIDKTQGNVLTTYNPESQWDWWVIGGRWGGYLTLKPDAEIGLPTEESAFGMAEESVAPNRGDAARVQDIVPESLSTPYSYIDPNGAWHSKGKMGWWAISDDDKSDDEWTSIFLKHVQELSPETWLVACDLHI